MGLVNGVAPDAELDAMVASITGAIAQNAPLTIALAKAAAREIAKPESKQDHKKLEKHGQGLLRQRGLQGRPPRLHGEEEAGFQRTLALGARHSSERRHVWPQRSLAHSE